MTDKLSREIAEKYGVEIPPGGLKILRLKVNNIMAVVAADIAPTGDVVYLCGKNFQGKTSTLWAISAGFIGPRGFPKRIVREGAREGVIEIDVGPEIGQAPLFSIHRRIFPGGNMKVEIIRTADRGKIQPPQEFLDLLYAKSNFDPLKFIESKESRVKMMYAITHIQEPLDTLALRRKEIFDGRALKNRALRDKKGALKEAQLPKNAPSRPVDTAELVEQRRVIQNELDAYRAKERECKEAERALAGFEADKHRAVEYIRDCDAEITRLKDALAAAIEKRKAGIDSMTSWEDKIKKATERRDRIDAEYKAMINPSRGLEIVDRHLAEAGDMNERYRIAQAYRAQAAEVDDLETEVAEMTEQIKALDRERLALFENANYPVEGMRFGEDDLTINGLPFTQMSDAQQLLMAMEIGAAQHPILRVICLRRANDLDDDGQAIVERYAEENHYQLWPERIEIDGEASVIFKAGEAIGGKAVVA